MSELIEKAIRDAFPEAVRETSEIDGVLNVKLDPNALVGVCELLHT